MTFEWHLFGNLEGLQTKLKSLDPTRHWKVSVTAWKSTRTLEQNGRLWAHVYKTLGDGIGCNVDEVHQLMGYKFLRYEKKVNGKVETFIKSTKKLNTSEMADYQEAIARFASGMGIYIE